MQHHLHALLSRPERRRVLAATAGIAAGLLTSTALGTEVQAQAVAPAVPLTAAQTIANTDQTDDSSAAQKLADVQADKAATIARKGPARLTPFVVYRNLFEGNKSGAYGSILTDSYSRLYIISTTTSTSDGFAGDNPNRPLLPYSPRNVVERYLLGRESSLSLTVTVNNNLFKATVPLVSLDHKSDTGNGEQWTRSIYQTAENFPLFLIASSGEGGTPSITLSLKGNVTGKSNVAGSSITAILGLANAISPTSRIVTTLSAASVKSEADAIDKAVSNLYDRAIQEDNIADQDLRFWAPSGALLVNLYVPKDNFRIRSGKNAGSLEESNLFAGQWFIKFESPRPSLFVDWRMCVGPGSGMKKDPSAQDDNSFATDTVVQRVSRPTYTRCVGYFDAGTFPGDSSALTRVKTETVRRVYEEADPASILQTDLVNIAGGLGTVESYINQQQFFKTDQVDLVKAAAVATAPKGSSKGTATSPTAKVVDGAKLSDLCENTYEKIISLKMTTTDARLVLWAMANGMTNLPAEARAVITDGPAAAAIHADACYRYVAPILMVRHMAGLPFAGTLIPDPAPGAKITLAKKRNTKPKSHVRA